MVVTVLNGRNVLKLFKKMIFGALLPVFTAEL